MTLFFGVMGVLTLTLCLVLGLTVWRVWKERLPRHLDFTWSYELWDTDQDFPANIRVFDSDTHELLYVAENSTSLVWWDVRTRKAVTKEQRWGLKRRLDEAILKELHQFPVRLLNQPTQ